MVTANGDGLDQGRLDRIQGLAKVLAAQRRSAKWWAGLSASGIALSVLARMNVQEVLGEARLFSVADVWPTLIVLGTVSLCASLLLWAAARYAKEDLPASAGSAVMVLLLAYGAPIVGYWYLYYSLSRKADKALSRHGYQGARDVASIEFWLAERGVGAFMGFDSKPGSEKCPSISDVEGREVTLEQAMRKNPDFGAWIRALDLHLETVGDHRRYTDWEPQQLAYGYLEHLQPNSFLEAPASRRRRLSSVLRR